MTRRRSVQRLTSAIIGAGVATLGGVAITSLSGRDVDLQLVLIVALAAAGVWLLLTAALASSRRDGDGNPYGADAANAAPPAWERAGSVIDER